MVDPDLIRCREKWTWTSGTKKDGVKLSGSFTGISEVLNHDFQFAKTEELVLGCCTYWILLVDFIPMKYEYFGVDRAACTDSIFLYHLPVGDAPAISLCGEAAGVARWRLLQGRIQGFLLGTLVKGWEPCTMNQEALKKLFRWKPTTLIMTLISDGTQVSTRNEWKNKHNTPTKI